MENKENVVIDKKDYKIVDTKEYKSNISDIFINIPNVANSIICDAQEYMNKVEDMLYCAPAFINAVRMSIPEPMYKTLFNENQKREFAKGTIKLMAKKDGSLMANLVDSQTHRVVGTVSLKEIELNPETLNAMSEFSTQMQLAQIAEQMKEIQCAVEEVRKGQENDRLATAYSCQQKLLQIMKVKNETLKRDALLKLALDSEDSRNLLMLSQSENLSYLKKQPKSFWLKFIKGATQTEIDKKITDIRESLNAVNMVSLVEAIAYKELGEEESSKISLNYYYDYLNKAYLDEKDFVERLDLLDSSPKNYWTKNLPIIKSKIEEISKNNQKILDKGSN